MISSISHSPQASARERILHTAHDLFYREGVRATGINQVIAEAGVTKVTFYRHYPSKDDLIQAFLGYRHQKWMAWFNAALQRHGGGLDALVPALGEWFGSADFRGCAFINSTGELGNNPQVQEITRQHKQAMTEAIRNLLPSSPDCEQDAQAIALMVDGAIVGAQMHARIDETLSVLDGILTVYCAARFAGSAQ